MALSEEEFLTIATKINQVYRDKQPITKQGINIWYDLLSDLDAKTLNLAVSNYIKSNKYPPTIADLRNEYQLIIDKIARINNELKDIYNRTSGIYPDMYLNADENTRKKAAKDAQMAWWDLVKQKPIGERIAFALRIENTTNKYVRLVEADTNRQKIPTLAEFFRGAR